MQSAILPTSAFALLLQISLTVWNAEATADDHGGLVVKLNSGLVRGGERRSVFGATIEQFLGIPYAEPPVGKLHFSHPQPVKPWGGVRDATKYAARCPQNEDSFPGNYTVGMFTPGSFSVC